MPHSKLKGRITYSDCFDSDDNIDLGIAITQDPNDMSAKITDVANIRTVIITHEDRDKLKKIRELLNDGKCKIDIYGYKAN